MFLVSKLLAFLTQPVSWAILLLLAGLLALRRWRKGGLAICWAALVVLLLTGWLAPISVLMHQLESRYPPPPASTNLAQYKGVIVLGGAMEDSDYWEVPGRIALRAEGERMIVPVALMQRNPHLTMLFTGGDDNVSPGRLTEADRAKIFFDLLGVDASRVIYESKSRTTYENGLYSSQLPGVNVGEPWLLLTTAAHMQRSMAVFKKLGWNVTPYCVDYRTTGKTDWAGYSLRRGVDTWFYYLHETIGYASYWLTGRI